MPYPCDCSQCVDYRARFTTEPTFSLYERDDMPNTIALEDLAGPADDELPDETLIACAACGDEYDEDDLIEPADSWIRRNYHDSRGETRICSECAEYCDECGEYFRYMSDHRDNYCDNCGDYYCATQNMSWCDDCETNRCEGCGDCESCSEARAIRDYNWVPPEFVLKGDRSRVMMGLELEITGRQERIVSCVHNQDDSEHHLYMKHDGSVDGVEIVTHPATLEWTRNEIDWQQLLSDMSDENCRAIPRDNGLHVHVSRESFTHKSGTLTKRHSKRHQLTWLTFLYRNSAALESLARREACSWCKWNDVQPGELLMKAGEYPTSSDRYLAVNCNNRATIELRFFASTLDVVELFAAVEFADASVEYTRQLRASDVVQGNGLSWSAFIAWADAQGTYSALCAESRRRVPPDTETASRLVRVPVRSTRARMEDVAPRPNGDLPMDGCNCGMCEEARRSLLSANRF